MKKQIATALLTLAVVTTAFSQAPTFSYPESYVIDKKDIARTERIIGNPPMTEVVLPNPHPDAQWYPNASLGLFMHWGIHSVVGAQPSWDMIANYIYGGKVAPPDKYYGLAKVFDPKQYDPDKWLRAAKEAGFTYAVLTSKHHDGYALWPSKYGIGTKQYMNGRDLLQPYVDACRANGLKVGLYFSPRDWHYPGLMEPSEYDANLFDTPRPVKDREVNYRNFITFLSFAMQQMEEILTRYGKIDILWLDGMNFRGIDDMHTEQIYAWVRSLQPGIVINDRWSNIVNPDDPDGSSKTLYGDFTTPFECQLPSYKPSRWWECCHIWTTKGGCGWGYDSTGSFRSHSWFFEHLAACRSLGGNFLVNVGPSGEGEMTPAYYKQMDDLKAWMVHSGESLLGAGPTPGAQLSNARITTRPGIWYLHVLPELKRDVSVETGKRPASVTLLRTGEPVTFGYRDGFLTFRLTAEQRTDVNDVVKITF